MHRMCEAAGCRRRHRALGLCDVHYRQMLKQTEPIYPPGTLAVECPGCARVIAVVSTQAAVWQALAAHECTQGVHK